MTLGFLWHRQIALASRWSDSDNLDDISTFTPEALQPQARDRIPARWVAVDPSMGEHFPLFAHASRQAFASIARSPQEKDSTQMMSINALKMRCEAAPTALPSALQQIARMPPCPQKHRLQRIATTIVRLSRTRNNSQQSVAVRPLDGIHGRWRLLRRRRLPRRWRLFR